MVVEDNESKELLERLKGIKNEGKIDPNCNLGTCDIDR